MEAFLKWHRFSSTYLTSNHLCCASHVNILSGLSLSFWRCCGRHNPTLPKAAGKSTNGEMQYLDSCTESILPLNNLSESADGV